MKAPIGSPFDELPPEAPRGVSVFSDSHDQHTWDPGELCERAIRCGASAVLWWGFARDGRHLDLATARALVQAATAFQLASWFWYFPRPETARASAEHAAKLRAETGARLCFDWEPPGALRTAWSRATIDEALACRPDAVTTLPSYARHPLLEHVLEAGVRVVLPQLERSGSDGPLVDRTLRAFARPGVAVELVVGAFTVREEGDRARLPNDPGRLRGDITRALGPTDPPRAPGIAVYSLGAVSFDEAAVLRETAARWA